MKRVKEWFIGFSLIALIQVLTLTIYAQTKTLVNHADPNGAVSRGSNVIITDSDILDHTIEFAYPVTSYSGVSITFGGISALIWKIAPGEIVCRIPDDSPTGTPTIVLTKYTNTQVSFSPSSIIGNYNPAIYTDNDPDFATVKGFYRIGNGQITPLPYQTTAIDGTDSFFKELSVTIFVTGLRGTPLSLSNIRVRLEPYSGANVEVVPIAVGESPGLPGYTLITFKVPSSHRNGGSTFVKVKHGILYSLGRFITFGHP